MGKTTSVEDFVPPADAKRILSEVKKRKKADIKSSDIPAELSTSFQRIFVPRLLEWAGIQHPWHAQTDDEIVGLWETVLPDQILDSDTTSIIVKIVSLGSIVMLKLTVDDILGRG